MSTTTKTATPKTPRASKKIVSTSNDTTTSTPVVEKRVDTQPVNSPAPKRSRTKKTDDAATSGKSQAEETTSVVVDDKHLSSDVSSTVPESVIEPTISVNAELANLEIVENASSPLEKLRRHHQILLGQLAHLTISLGKVRSELLKLDQSYAKEYKLLAKQSVSKKQMKKKTGNRAPSGFVRPTKISDEMAVFLSRPLGTEIARTEVTRSINKYIIDHDLQDKSNRRRILADVPLRTLLRLTDEDELTYFNLQKHMKVHFSKLVPDVVLTQVEGTGP